MARKIQGFPPPPNGPEVPTKETKRPVGYDRDETRYQTRFGRIPLTIRKEGQETPNPFRNVGVFVVHGIGNQSDTETAVSLRRGVEDAVPLIDPGNSQPKPEQSDQWIVPPPYIYDGFWADYGKLEWLWDEEERSVLSDRQKGFFEGVVRSRSGGWIRNCGWLVQQGVRLVTKCRIPQWPVYVPLTMFSVLLYVLVLIPGLRNTLTRFVNDARLYLEPQGDIELETVQLIDYRIGQMFLKMLGLDWELKSLPADKKLKIDGRPHRFEHVIWVAHSLGSVISYNVISDLLHRCEQIRREHPNRRKNVERVESGLRHFITIGSPLDKVFFLFGHGGKGILRPWPAEYLPNQKRDLTRNYDAIDPGLAENRQKGVTDKWRVNFWLNFFYGSDPVSGPLDKFVKDGERLVKNLSTREWRWPLISHVAYWQDVTVVSKILELAYPGLVKQHQIRFWPDRYHNRLSSVGIVFLSIFTCGILAGAWIYREELWGSLRNLLFGA